MKKIFCTVLIFAILISSSLPAFAATSQGATIQTSLQDQSVIVGPQAIPLYYTDCRNMGTQTAVRVRIGEAANQPLHGTVFSPPGGGFYWSDGGHEVSVSFTVAWGPFSLSVSPGGTGSSGQIQKSPYTNHACKLIIYKDIQVTRYDFYRKPHSQPNDSWTFFKTLYSQHPVKTYLVVELCK